jgi:hypothetical protein
MYSRYGKININPKKIIFGAIALILAVSIAYYLQSDNENKLENFGDYINYLFEKIYFIYITAFMTILFYVLFNFLLDNKDTIKREINTRGSSFINKNFGPDFINRSIKGGQQATNRLYNYTGGAYNYLRPKRAQIVPKYAVEPLYAVKPLSIPAQYPTSWMPSSMPQKSYNPFD